MDHDGHPTLHHIPIFAYPEWADVEQVYAGKTGELLESDKVWKARGREMAKMVDHGVKHDITLAECQRRGMKLVRSRWVDVRKALRDDFQRCEVKTCLRRRSSKDVGMTHLRVHLHYGYTDLWQALQRSASLTRA